MDLLTAEETKMFMLIEMQKGSLASDISTPVKAWSAFRAHLESPLGTRLLREIIQSKEERQQSNDAQAMDEAIQSATSSR